MIGKMIGKNSSAGDGKPTGKVRAFWLVVYALLCACEFVVDKLKDFASEAGHRQK